MCVDLAFCYTARYLYEIQMSGVSQIQDHVFSKWRYFDLFVSNLYLFNFFLLPNFFGWRFKNQVEWEWGMWMSLSHSCFQSQCFQFFCIPYNVGLGFVLHSLHKVELNSFYNIFCPHFHRNISSRMPDWQHSPADNICHQDPTDDSTGS